MQRDFMRAIAGRDYIRRSNVSTPADEMDPDLDALLVVAVELGRPTDELLAHLEDMPSDTASAACAALLTLATKWTESVPIEDPPAWDVGRFCAGFVRQSCFVDRLVDASLLSPTARRLKWCGEARRSRELRGAQLQDASAQALQSRRALRSRAINARALRRELRRAPEGDAGLAFLHAPLEMLRMQPPVYWSALRLDGLDELRLRATLHKVHIFAARYGWTAVPPPTRDAVQERLTALCTRPPASRCACM